MKEFMMIFIGGDYGEAQLSPEDIQKRIEKWNTWVEDLKKENLFVHGNALAPNAKRVESQEIITDGPFVETKELVGGYIVVKAENMDHALTLTERFPDYDLKGKVEVREILIY